MTARRTFIGLLGAFVVLAAFAFTTGDRAGAQTQTTLVKNTGQANADAISFSDHLALPFRTGDNTPGYTLNAIDVEVAIGNPVARPVTSYTTSIYQGSGTSLGTHVADLTSPTLQNGTNSFTASSGIALQGDTSYFLVLSVQHHGNRAPKFAATLSDGEDSGGAAGFTIGNQMLRSEIRRHPSSGAFLPPTTWQSASHSAVIEVNIKGSAKSPQQQPESSTPDNDRSEIWTVSNGEPGATYSIDGEEQRTVNSDGTYQVRVCTLYDRDGRVVGRIWGGTAPCPGPE